ncbi:lactonase family protein [Lacrimispora sp.]|uniref:lactonase family protein n=1 Tax=Lacrimispora sp. TaxID=2719234 RepID=UPI002FD8DD37
MKYAYVGCRTTRERNARGEGLKVYEISGKTGDWKEIQCLCQEENPSYQAFDNEKKYLYSVHGDISKVSSYKIREDGTLEHINTVDIGGRNPVFITPDKTNEYLLVAALQGGAVYSLKRNSDGSIGEIVDKVSYEGREEGRISFVHQCIWDQTKTYLAAPAQGRIQGYGQVRIFKFDSENGHLSETCQFKARQYAEPRHIAFHPANKFAYMINEKDNTMTYFGFDEENGTLEPRQILPTLPDTYTGEGQASASIIDPTGRILIGSNRIHESLVLYKINQDTGYMTTLGYVPVLGKTPRFITFNEDGSLLYAANEDSDTIVEMKLDGDRGIVEYTGRIIQTESPVCIIFK